MTQASASKKRKTSPWLIPLIALIVAMLLLVLLIPAVERTLYPMEYTTYVERYAKAYGVPENLIYAVIRTESRFHPDAISSAGAIGLMQLMPATFRWLSDDMLGEGLEDGMIADPETNIRYGVYYLSRLYARYGDWTCACAAYNAGNSRVDRWLEDPTLTNQNGKLLIDAIPIDETQSYVRQIQSAYTIYERRNPVQDHILFE